MGEGQAPARLVPDPDPLGGEHFFVDVPMPGFQPWTHEKCPLYTAQVKLTKEGRVLDEVTFRFGMREIGVQGPELQTQRQEPVAARIEPGVRVELGRHNHAARRGIIWSPKPGR